MNQFMDFSMDDARAYWLETYVGVKVRGEYKAFRVEGVGRSKELEDIILKVYNEDEWKAVALNDPDLISYVPQLGMKQVGEEACYLTKAAQRQWKKGLRTGQYNSKYVNYMSKNYQHCNMNLISQKARDGMFNPTHCGLVEGLRFLANNGISIALSQNFAIAQHARSVDPVLCYRGDLVGKVIKGELCLLKEYSELTETLTEEVEACHAM